MSRASKKTWSKNASKKKHQKKTHVFVQPAISLLSRLYGQKGDGPEGLKEGFPPEGNPNKKGFPQKASKTKPKQKGSPRKGSKTEPFF